jgi:hypothetical protein
MSEERRNKVPPIMHSDIPGLLSLPLIALIGLPFAMFLPALSFARNGHLVGVFWTALTVAGVGVGLLFWARLPLYRQGKYFGFGSRALPPSSVPIYRAAYVLLIPSILFLLLLAL